MEQVENLVGRGSCPGIPAAGPAGQGRRDRSSLRILCQAPSGAGRSPPRAAAMRVAQPVVPGHLEVCGDGDGSPTGAPAAHRRAGVRRRAPPRPRPGRAGSGPTRRRAPPAGRRAGAAPSPGGRRVPRGGRRRSAGRPSARARRRARSVRRRAARQPQVGDVVAHEPVGGTASWLTQGDDQRRGRRGVRDPEAGRRARPHHRVAQQCFDLEGHGRPTVCSRAGAAARRGRVDDPALVDQTLEHRTDLRRGRTLERGQRGVQPGTVAQDEPVGLVEADLQVRVVTAYDVQARAQHRSRQPRPPGVRPHVRARCHRTRGSRRGSSTGPDTTRPPDREARGSCSSLVRVRLRPCRGCG